MKPNLKVSLCFLAIHFALFSNLALAGSDVPPGFEELSQVRTSGLTSTCWVSRPDYLKPTLRWKPSSSKTRSRCLKP